MNNGQTKEQHYIPRFYMKKFANSNKKFNIIDLQKNKEISNIPYMSQFKEKYFYDYDNKIENELSILEQKWSQTINNITLGIYPSKKDKETLREFALYQKNRTLYRSNELLEMSWQSQKLKIEMTCKMKKIKLSEDKIAELKKSFIDNFPNKTVVTSLNIIKQFHNIIDDLDVAIIKYNTKMKLISSDNPIVHYNNFDMKSVGYNNAGLIIFFPLSYDMLCVIYDAKMYPYLDKSKIIQSNNEYEVKYLNYYQILNANNYIFYRDSSQGGELLKMLKKGKIRQIMSFPKLKTDILGPDYKKMISFQAKYIYLEHNFTFAKLSNKAIVVPKNARDWFPRKYDEKFANGNLKSRKAIVPMFKIMKKDEELKNTLKNAIIWNDEEIDKYITFVREYWK